MLRLPDKNYDNGLGHKCQENGPNTSTPEVVMVDMSKTFDRVKHSRQIAALFSFGISWEAIVLQLSVQTSPANQDW